MVVFFYFGRGNLLAGNEAINPYRDYFYASKLG